MRTLCRVSGVSSDSADFGISSLLAIPGASGRAGSPDRPVTSDLSRATGRVVSPLALSAVAALCLWVAAIPAVAQPGFDIRFGPTTPQAYGLDDKVIDLIKGAKTSLDMAFYELRLDSITQAIVDASKRGVTVRFLVDDTNYYGKDDAGVEVKTQRNPFIAKLLAAKIPVHQDNDRKSLMHDKFCVVDGKLVWTGSYNLTDTCSYVNNNNLVVIDDKAAAQIYARKFEEMFAKELFGKDRPSHTDEQKTTVQGTPIEVRFAPEDDPISREIEILKGAKHAIYFMQFAFTDQSMGDTLLAMAKQGVEVKGIFDHRLYRSTGPYSQLSKLTAAGIPVLVYNNGEGKFHHKVFIVDPGSDDATVITGSENTSTNGNDGNDENVLYIHSKVTAATFKAEFDKLFGQLSHVTADIVYSEPPVVGGTIDQLDVLICTNGETINDVQIEFPARWKIDASTVKSFEFLKGDQPLPAGAVKKGPNLVELPGVDLTASGPGSLLTLRLKGVTVPKIAGGYSPIVRVKRPSDSQLAQLSSLPVLTIYSANDPKLYSGIFQTMTELFHHLQTVEGAGSGAGEELQKHWDTAYANLKATILSQAEEGRFTPIERLADFLEAADKADLATFRKITQDARELRRILKSKAPHSPTAKDLLDRFDKLMK